MNYFNKIEGLKNDSIEIFFITINGLLFLDFACLTQNNLTLKNNYNNLSIYEIIVFTCAFLCLFYLVKIVRIIMLTIFSIRFSKYKIHSKYYNLKILLEEAIHENNSVKYNFYKSKQKEHKKNNNLKHLSILTIVVLILNFTMDKSIIRNLLEYKIVFLFLSVVMFILFLYGVQKNEDDNSEIIIEKK